MVWQLLQRVVAVGGLGAAAASAQLIGIPDGRCAGNTAVTRSSWCNQSIDTDYTSHVPDTGVTREYWLELTDATMAPDGIPQQVVGGALTVTFVNGSIPGPTLFADWGDTVVVHVKNSSYTSKNGTSIHFHGIRQLGTNQNDGVVSITQCPTAPGQTTTYRWRAEQYGSSWYHSHFSLQAWQGVSGGIVINGPATANYNEDLGPLFLSDWSHSGVDELYARSRGQLVPPFMDNGLINGTNVFGQAGRHLAGRVVPGRSYRLRLVNVAADTHFQFSIDHHTMTVIAADLRYDVVIRADQGTVARNFWIRAVPQALCSANREPHNIRAILHYDAQPAVPTSWGPPHSFICVDETSRLVPWLPKTVGEADEQTTEIASLSKDGALYHCTLNSTSFKANWSEPSVAKVADRRPFQARNSVIALPYADRWFYMVIQTYLPVPQPIHLHGHDFFVLAQGHGVYRGRNVPLQGHNPMRRDTALLPAFGYMVIAFETDNLGV